MNIKQIIVGIFTASLFSLSIATEANSGLHDSLSGAPQWVLNPGDDAYSAVGRANIIRFRGEKGDGRRELWDIEMAEIEAIHKAKNKLYKELNLLLSKDFDVSETRFFKKDKMIGKNTEKK